MKLKKEWLVDLRPLGVMWFWTESGAWRFIQGRGLNGVDPYRRFLKLNAQPERVVR